MEGRKQLALSASKEMLDKPFSTWLANEASLQWFIPIPYFVKARFAMWNELLDESMPKTNYQYALGMWHYARDMALAHTNHTEGAEHELENLKKIIAKKVNKTILGKQGHDLLKIGYEILTATISNFKGDEKFTLKHLKLAAKMQDDMGYHESPDWYFPVKQMLGDAYLKWNHPAEAIIMYRQDLKQYPKNAWSLYGLDKALRSQGKNADADQVKSQFKEAWKYADIPVPINIFY